MTTAIATINGLAKASVKTVNGLAKASVKTVNGLVVEPAATVFLADDFNRADGVLTAPWSGDGQWATASVVSNQMGGTGTNTVSAWSCDPGTTQVDLTVTFTRTFIASANRMQVAINVEPTGSYTRGYFVEPNAPGSPAYAFYYYDGSQHNLYNSSTAPAANVPVTWHLKRVGNVVTLEENGVQKYSGTPAVLSTQTGVRGYLGKWYDFLDNFTLTV